MRAVLDQRVAIEMGSTILAGERARPNDLDLLDQAVARMEVMTTFDDYHRADVGFHLGVAQAAHSPRLVAAMTAVHGNLSDLVAWMPHPTERLTRANDQHRRLVTVLRQRNVPQASRLMREHLGDTEHILASG